MPHGRWRARTLKLCVLEQPGAAACRMDDPGSSLQPRWRYCTHRRSQRGHERRFVVRDLIVLRTGAHRHGLWSSEKHISYRLIIHPFFLPGTSGCTSDQHTCMALCMPERLTLKCFCFVLLPNFSSTHRASFRDLCSRAIIFFCTTASPRL